MFNLMNQTAFSEEAGRTNKSMTNIRRVDHRPAAVNNYMGGGVDLPTRVHLTKGFRPNRRPIVTADPGKRKSLGKSTKKSNLSTSKNSISGYDNENLVVSDKGVRFGREVLGGYGTHDDTSVRNGADLIDDFDMNSQGQGVRPGRNRKYHQTVEN